MTVGLISGFDPAKDTLGGVGHCFAWHVRVSPVFGFNF